MIRYIEGDIFTSPAQVIVNTVNTVGVMGKGIALEYKKRYPKMFQQYQTACEKHLLQPGKLMIYYGEDHWILLFPTKKNWRAPSKMEYIRDGLAKFVQTYAQKNITSIAFPKLGCGNGQLNWDEVRPLMEYYLKDLPIDVYIYLGTKSDEPIPEQQDQARTMLWLKRNAKELSCNAVLDDIKAHCGLFGYEFAYNRNKYAVLCEDGIRIEGGGGSAYSYEDETVENFWREIRHKSIVMINDYEEEVLVLMYLLCSLGYLVSIRVLDATDNSMKEGFQVNEGTGRVYSPKEGL